MSVRLAERRCNRRAAASHPVAVCDTRGRVLLRGRTANISAGGLLCLTDSRRALHLSGEVIVEVSLPSPRAGDRPSIVRTIRCRGSIIRREEIGQLVGLGIELGRRLA